MTANDDHIAFSFNAWDVTRTVGFGMLCRDDQLAVLNETLSTDWDHPRAPLSRNLAKLNLVAVRLMTAEEAWGKQGLV